MESSRSPHHVLKFTPAEEIPRAWAFGPFSFDANDRILGRGGASVPLSPKAAELLRLFLESGGRLLEKETLIALLWPGTFVEEGSLSQTVFLLRKALGDGFIETVPRRGYRFTAEVTRLDSAATVAGGHSSRPRWRLRTAFAAAAIALSVAATFAVALHRDPRAIGETIPASISPEARKAYLKGRYYWNRRTSADLDRAVDFFREATEREPRFALAWAGLADAYNFVAQAPRAKVAARRALEIDPHCAPAHAALGNANLFYDYDWAAAERSFDSALENDPTYATALHWRAFLYLAQRRYAEARRDIERARKLDPLSKIITTDVGAIEYYSRAYDRAMAHYRHALDLDPAFTQARLMIAWTYFRTGRLYDAQSMLENETDRFLEFQLIAARGEVDRTRAILGKLELEADLRPTGFSNYRIACGYVATGDHERALRWLSRAYEAHDGELALLHIDPSLDPIRATPAFAEFVRTHNLALR